MYIKTIKANQSEIEKLKERKVELEEYIKIVEPIIKDVKRNGDKALKKYAKKFDKINLSKIEVSKNEIKAAYKKVDKKTITAIKQSKANIEKYAKLQLPKEWLKETSKGISAGQLVRALDSVGCYVPAGKYPLVSTVLMNVLPAKVAGVKEIIICCPKPTAEILVAADICKANKIFRIGGSQAIAAMAYGTETIPKVNKIVGPGNIYVTAAKKYVYGDVGIDFIAGPSEVLIIADKNSNPEFIAADMLSQAEHDEFASSILITNSEKIADDTKKELKKQLKRLKTKNVAEKSLKKNGLIIIAKNIEQALEISNEIAPEHLEIMIDNKALLKKVRNAGAVFLGSYSVEAAGDYSSGPNHVLPTSGFAKVRAGLSVLDFIKQPTIQILRKEGLEKIKDSIIALAEVEGLKAHAESVRKRFN